MTMAGHLSQTRLQSTYDVVRFQSRDVAIRSNDPILHRCWRDCSMSLPMKLNSMWRDLCLMRESSRHLINDKWQCHSCRHHDRSLTQHTMEFQAQRSREPKFSQYSIGKLGNCRWCLQCQCSPVIGREEKRRKKWALIVKLPQRIFKIPSARCYLNFISCHWEIFFVVSSTIECRLFV